MWLRLATYALVAGFVAAAIGLFYVTQALKPKQPSVGHGPHFPKIDVGMIIIGLVLFATDLLAGAFAIGVGGLAFMHADRLDREGIATRGGLAVVLGLLGWCGFALMILFE